MNKIFLFFLHIPKTAGTFFNKFLSMQFNSYIDHIEVKDLPADEIKQYEGFSGHVPLPKAQKEFDLADRKIITILRNPIEQIVSHITFVRRELAEPSEKERLKTHSKPIQEIALKLKKTDLSNPAKIEKFITWLEKKNYWLFHDCQTRYLGGGSGEIKPAVLNNALKNLEKINYVGITERLKEFMILLNLSEGYKLIDYNKENVTKNRYGLDINNSDIRKALQPLIQNEHIIYMFARKKFINDLHKAMIERELKRGPRYSSVRIDMIFNEVRREDV